MAEALEVQLEPGITMGKFSVKVNKHLTFSVLNNNNNNNNNELF